MLLFVTSILKISIELNIRYLNTFYIKHNGNVRINEVYTNIFITNIFNLVVNLKQFELEFKLILLFIIIKYILYVIYIKNK